MERLEINSLALSAGAVIVVVAVWLSARRPRWRDPERGEGSAPPTWRTRWGFHLETVRNPWRFGGACALSLAMKAVAWVGLYAVQRSLGVDLPPAPTALVLAAVTFATMVSVTPGNLGFFELGAVASYQFLGVAAGQAAALALLVHVTFLLPILGAGYATLLLQPFVDRASCARTEAATRRASS